MKALLPLLLMVSVSCAKNVPEAGEKQATTRVQNPIALSWQDVKQVGPQLELTANIQRLAPVRMPLKVTLTLPKGVTLKDGRASFELLPNSESTVHHEAFVFDVPSTPAEDLELNVDGETSGQGFHLHLAYRFGRAEVAPVAPRTEGPDVIINGKNLGPSVPLQK